MFLILVLVLFSMAAEAQDSLQLARLKSLQGKIAPFSVFAKKDSLIPDLFLVGGIRGIHHRAQFSQHQSGAMANHGAFSFYGRCGRRR